MRKSVQTSHGFNFKKIIIWRSSRAITHDFARQASRGFGAVQAQRRHTLGTT